MPTRSKSKAAQAEPEPLEAQLAWMNHFFRLIRPRGRRPSVVQLEYTEKGTVASVTTLDFTAFSNGYAGMITQHPDRFSVMKDGAERHQSANFAVAARNARGPNTA